MKKVEKPDKNERLRKSGKRSLYNPTLGARNYRKAQQGRFAEHPAFLAAANLSGALIALNSLVIDTKEIALRVRAVALQTGKAMDALRRQIPTLKSRGDKLHFAEAFAWFFDPPKLSDVNVWRTCWRLIEMQTRGERPSRAELRAAVEKEDGITFSDEKWKRLLKRTGLDMSLPTHREKYKKGILPNV